MAKTINGVGTTFYGKCKFHADHSYITTKWVVLLYFPIVPVSSYRFIEESSSSFQVVDADIPLEIMQVLRTWSFAALLIYLFMLVEEYRLGTVVLLPLWCMAAVIPFSMRWLAKRNAGIQ